MFHPGETVLLYLGAVSTEKDPSITVTNFIHIPLALDNGVFDVSTGELGPVGRVNDDTVVRPRGIGGEMFAEGTEFMLSDIKQAITDGSEDEVGPVGQRELKEPSVVGIAEVTGTSYGGSQGADGAVLRQAQHNGVTWVDRS